VAAEDTAAVVWAALAAAISVALAAATSVALAELVWEALAVVASEALAVAASEVWVWPMSTAFARARRFMPITTILVLEGAVLLAVSTTMASARTTC
jgi:hypothetical protein